MLLGLLITGIAALQNGGKPIMYRGVPYYIDFTGIIQLSFPSFYRIPGDSFSMLSMISTICADYGCDFLVYLENVGGLNVIKFKTVSRRSQPVLNKIRQFVSSRTQVSVKSTGYEARTETTSYIVSGGEVHTIYITPTNTDIWPYWGNDVNGNLIIGQNTGDDHTFLMNAAPVFDVLGGFTYECNVLELRSALHSIETWTTYMEQEKSDLYNQILEQHSLEMCGRHQYSAL
jgi:hypothetical protein